MRTLLRRGRWIYLLLLWVPWASAQFGTPALERGKAPIALLRQSLIEDVEAQRLLASVSRYSPDATFMDQDGTHADGIAAIRELYAAVFSQATAQIQMNSRTSGESGELAYDSGAWVETLTDKKTHVATTSHGDYLTIYRRMGLNRWLIVQQAWTASQAMGAAGR